MCGRGVPDSMRGSLDANTEAALLRDVARWLNEEPGSLRASDSGVILAKSEDDYGGEPPLPPSALAQGRHVCGPDADRLVEVARARVRAHAGPEGVGPVRCEQNVCCYLARMEFDSAGGVVFTPQPGGGFAVRAVYEVADNGTLGAEYVAAQYAVVNAHLTRLASTSCPVAGPTEGMR